MVYDRNPATDIAFRIMRVRMWEAGHTFDELDRMPFTDFSDIVGYWSGKSRGEARLNKMGGRQDNNDTEAPSE